jgi:lathosterol oxidase
MAELFVNAAMNATTNATAVYGPNLNFVNVIVPLDIVHFYVDWVVQFLWSTNDWNIWAQYALLTAGVTLFGALLFTVLCPLSYWIFFIVFKDKYHPATAPQPFKGQVQMELAMSFKAFPFLSLLTTPFMVLQLRGYSKLYWNYTAQHPFSWIDISIATVFFLLFTDTGIYWIHRWEHTFPWIYKFIHKPHHKWIVPTPFASFAFHPLDGWAQSLPYHLFMFIYPTQTLMFLFLFTFVQIWTVSIHDGVDWCGEKEHSLRSQIINGSLHHTIHHSKFVYNYGQYFTFWDRMMGSHCSWEDLQKKRQFLYKAHNKKQE